jgi:hypothetical protein
MAFPRRFVRGGLNVRGSGAFMGRSLPVRSARLKRWHIPSCVKMIECSHASL